MDRKEYNGPDLYWSSELIIINLFWRETSNFINLDMYSWMESPKYPVTIAMWLIPNFINLEIVLCRILSDSNFFGFNKGLGVSFVNFLSLFPSPASFLQSGSI